MKTSFFNLFNPNVTFVKTAWDQDPEVNPGVKGFWDNLPQQNHLLSKHPVLSQHGKNLARESHQATKQNLVNKGLDPNADIRTLFQQMQSLIQQVNQIEMPHKQQLLQLAQQIVSQRYGVPAAMLKGQLSSLEEANGNEDAVDINDAAGGFDDQMENPNAPLTPEDQPELDKRITSNMFIQGASTSDLLNLHHMAGQELNQIDPKLLPLYDKLANLTHYAYFLMDAAKMDPQTLEQAAGASESIDEQGNIVAKATSFPYLLHEFVKGTFERIAHTHHVKGMQPEQANKVRKHVDTIQNEPLFLQSGPRFWKKFLEFTKNIPGLPPIANVVAGIHGLPPAQMHEIVNGILSNNPQTAQQLKQMFTVAPEPEMPGYEENNEPDDNWWRGDQH